MTLITRPHDLQDNATPSGDAVAVTSLLKLAGLSNEIRYVDLAHEARTQIQPMTAQYPLGFGQWLQALAYALSKPREIAIVGPTYDERTRALLGAATSGFQPHRVVAFGPGDQESPAVPLLENRRLVDGQPAAYVCRDFSCRAPVTEPEALRVQID